MPKAEHHDEEEHHHKSINLTAPIRKCTLMPDKSHPQRLVLIERSKQKPATSLDDWFDTGLIRQQVEDKHGNVKSTYISGGRPLPAGYGGCDAEKTLVTAFETGILMWPIRTAIMDGIDNKKPWTLYHYTHKASFENFHKIFHEMAGIDPEECQREIYHQLQVDYQERVPNPSNVNMKGEPMLSTSEPGKFPSKHMVLQHVFGREVSGYSRQGNSYDQFADYCVAFQVPGSVCFQQVNQVSGANVRFCKDSLEQLMKRAELQEYEKQRKLKHKGEEEQGEHHDHQAAGKLSCLGRLCGKRPEKAEHWDEVEVPDHKHKKKDREMDRWKQRMAKRWLEEHVSDCAKHTAQEFKSKDAQKQQEAEAADKAAINEKLSHKKSHIMEVNHAATHKFDLGIGRKFTKMLNQFSTRKAEKAADAHYLSDANREVTHASNLFSIYGKKQSTVSEEEVEENEGKAVDEKLKRMRKCNSMDDGRPPPTGTKRIVIQKSNRKSAQEDAGGRRRSSLRQSEFDQVKLGDLEAKMAQQKADEKKAKRDSAKEGKAGEHEHQHHHHDDKDNEKEGEEEETENKEDGEDKPKKKSVTVVNTPPESPPKSAPQSEASGGDTKRSETSQAPDSARAADSDPQASSLREASAGEGQALGTIAESVEAPEENDATKKASGGEGSLKASEGESARKKASGSEASLKASSGEGSLKASESESARKKVSLGEGSLKASEGESARKNASSGEGSLKASEGESARKKASSGEGSLKAPEGESARKKASSGD